MQRAIPLRLAVMLIFVGSSFIGLVGLRPASAASTTIVAMITASDDDARSGDLDGYNSTEATARVGAGHQRPNVNGYRFASLNIPPGATIDSVSFSLVKHGPQWQRLSVDLAFEASDNAATFSDTDQPRDRPLTNARSILRDDVWRTDGTRYTLGDPGALASALQEIVNRAGWRAGNSVALIAYGPATGGWSRINFRTFDAGSASVPRLEVTYRQAESAASPTVTPMPTPTGTPTAVPPPPPTPTLIPTPTPTAAPAIGEAGNGALRFDGIDDEARGGLLAGSAGTQTIEAWFRPSAAGQSGLILVNSDDALGWIVELYQGQLRFWMADTDGTWRAVTQWNTFLAAGTWYHLAVTYDAASEVARLFLNGVPRTEAALGTLSQGPAFRLGGLAGFPYPFANGQLDEVRISRTIRYTGTFAPPATALAADDDTLALYHFDEAGGQELTDASGNGNTLILGVTAAAESSDPARVASSAPTRSTGTPPPPATPTPTSAPTAAPIATPTAMPPTPTPTASQSPSPSPSSAPSPSTTANRSLLVGPGFSDVSPHQVVRASDGVLYAIAPTCDAYPACPGATLRVYRGDQPGTPTRFIELDAAHRAAGVGTAAVALDGTDRIHVLWLDRAGRAIYAIFDTRVGLWNAQEVVDVTGWTTFGQGDQGAALAVDAAGIPHAAWSARGSDGQLQIRYAARPAGGWATPARADDMPLGPNRNAWHPTLAFTPDGALLLAWIEGSFNYSPDGIIRIRIGNGGNWGASVALPDVAMTGIDNGPSLLITGDGVRHIAFLDTANTVRYWYDAGQGWRGDRQPTRQVTHNPSLGPDGKGGVYLYGHGAPQGGLEGHGDNLYRFQLMAGQAAWGPWTLYVAGAFDSSVNTRWAQFFHHFPETIDILYWADPYPNQLYLGTE